jgi:hypothetical protein
MSKRKDRIAKAKARDLQETAVLRQQERRKARKFGKLNGKPVEIIGNRLKVVAERE